MSHKDYRAMAAQIASMENRLCALAIAENFAKVAKRDNPRFESSL